MTPHASIWYLDDVPGERWCYTCGVSARVAACIGMDGFRNMPGVVESAPEVLQKPTGRAVHFFERRLKPGVQGQTPEIALLPIGNHI